MTKDQHSTLSALREEIATHVQKLEDEISGKGTVESEIKQAAKQDSEVSHLKLYCAQLHHKHCLLISLSGWLAVWAG